jgi:hypothetical protein
MAVSYDALKAVFEVRVFLPSFFFVGVVTWARGRTLWLCWTWTARYRLLLLLLLFLLSVC